MKKLYFSMLSLFMYSLTAIAQNATLPSVEKKQFTYHLLANVSYEVGVSRLNTVRLSGPIDGGAVYEVYTDFQGNTQTQSYYYVRPAIVGEFRHYYNLDKRLEKGKRVDKNSGNFLAPVVIVYGPTLLKSDGLEAVDFGGVIGGVWGIQRNYGKTFNFQLSIGPGVGFADGEASFVPIVGGSFGFRIGN